MITKISASIFSADTGELLKACLVSPSEVYADYEFFYSGGVEYARRRDDRPASYTESDCYYYADPAGDWEV